MAKKNETVVAETSIVAVDANAESWGSVGGGGLSTDAAKLMPAFMLAVRTPHLPWGMRVKLLTAVMADVPENDIPAFHEAYLAYHKAILDDMGKVPFPMGLYTMQADLVAAIEMRESEIAVIIEKAGAKRRAQREAAVKGLTSGKASKADQLRMPS